MGSPRIVVGLGNPGADYDRTRHNLGFRVLDVLAERGGATWSLDREAPAWVAQGVLGACAAVLAKPETFMNRSGSAAVALCRRFSIAPGEMLVVYDDADLELGRVRVRPQGTAGGHNGLQSLIDALGTDEIPRVRLGVCGAGRQGRSLADYVLAPFEADEVPAVEDLVRAAVEAVEDVLELGLAAAMNRHNAPRSSAPDGPD